VVVPCTLACNSTRTPPNQVSYLKGSSMEFFTLGPTPKIDFRSAQQQHTQQWLKRDSLSTITLQCNSLRTKEFNTKFLQFSSLGTSIYRLQVQLSVFLEKPRRRLDGRHKGSGWTTVRSAFFPVLSRVWTVLPRRPDGRTSTALNFHIKASRVRTKGMVV